MSAEPIQASVATDMVALAAIIAVVAALAVSMLVHWWLERRRAKQDELADLQRRAVSAIQSHE